MAALDEIYVVLHSLRGVWDEDAVDELDHALQSGLQAVEDGADDELALAAALHDIGHSPLLRPARHEGGQHHPAHEDLAREWLTTRFGERVGWLAGAHVAAKQYLAATDPGYRAVLSPTSTRALDAQGGPATDPVLTGHRWWPDAIRLRRYDDAAKVPHARALSITDILLIAEHVLQQQESL